MATPKRKPEAQHMTSATLLGIMGQLALASSFEITAYTPEEFELVEDLFEAQIAQDPDFLHGFTRILECSISLDNYEYHNLVLDLCGIKVLAKKSVRYIHCFEIRENEICVLNLQREVLRRVKPKEAKTHALAEPKPVKEAEKVSAPATDDQREKQVKKLQTQLQKALDNEDYRFAAVLQRKLDDLQGK